MLLTNKNAIVYGAGGSLGGAVARALAREGARVFVTGRRRDPLRKLATEIIAAGGSAEASEVDALDAEAVNDCLSRFCGGRARSISRSTRSGLTATPGGIGYPHVGGFGPACCAIEGFSPEPGI